MSKPKTKQELQDEIARLEKKIAGLGAQPTGNDREPEALRECEVMAKALFDDVDYPVLHIDREGVILQTNAALAALVKMTTDELTGRSAYDLYPGARDLPPDRLKYAFETGRTARHEIKVLLTPEPRWFTLCYVPVRGSDGNVESVLITTHDITDLKQAEEQQSLLSSIVKQSSEGVALVDKNGDIEYINDSFAGMHGYKASELIGRNLAIFHTEEQMAVVIAANERIQKTGNFNGEVWHVHRDGRVFPTIMHNFLLRNDEGDPIGMVGTARDITDLKHAEEQQGVLSSIVRQSQEGVALIDMDANLLYVNDAFAHMHGYEASELGGKHVAVFHTEEQMPVVLASIAELRNTGEFHGEIWHKHRDGRVFPTVMHHSLLLDEHGVPTRMVGTARDITDDKLAEAELRESQGKYKLLIDNIGCPIMLFDLNGTLLLINDEGAKNLGGVPADFVGKTMGKIVPQQADNYLQRLERVAGSGECEEHADALDTPFGTRWFWSNLHPARKTDGTVYGVQIVTRDMTELKETEESLRAMSEELSAERESLNEKNIALKQVLDYMESQKQGWADKLQANLERAIRPFLDELTKVLPARRGPDIDELRSTLDAILGSDNDDFSRRMEGLTSRELVVCKAIAKGRSSKEIAGDLNLSLLTVMKHREKVRKKLGLTGKRVDLSTYLHRHLAQ